MSKVEANGLSKIEVPFLKKQGYFSGVQGGIIQWTSNFHGYQGSASLQITEEYGTKYLRIRCSSSNYGMQEGYEREVEIVSTGCHYGGVRYWMLCPSWGCGRRIGTLYFYDGRFACRHCLNLTYSSQNASKRYNGFISAPMLDAMEAKVKRTHYRGNPTRKYRRLLKMQDRFLRDIGWINATLGDRVRKNRSRTR